MMNRRSYRPPWVIEYLDIPYLNLGRTREGLDCCGIVRLVAMEKFGVPQLPMYNDKYDKATDSETVEKVIQGEMLTNWPRFHGPVRGGLVVVLRAKAWHAHIGIMVSPYEFLHIREGAEVTCDDLEDRRWKHRVISFHEYAPRTN